MNRTKIRHSIEQTVQRLEREIEVLEQQFEAASGGVVTTAASMARTQQAIEAGERAKQKREYQKRLIQILAT